MTGAIPEQHEIDGFQLNKDLSQPPHFIDGADTLCKLWSTRCRNLGQRTAHREKEYGIWKSFSWDQFYDRARQIGLGLRRLGLQRGEVVSILAEDSKEWIYADIGIQSVGGIASGVYTTDSARQLAYLVNDSDSRFLFVENDEQLDKYLSIADKMPGLLKVIVFDLDGLHDFKDDNVISLEQLYQIGAEAAIENPTEFEDEIAKGEPEDTCLLIYTSGTTGDPKGVEISNANIMFSMSIGPQTLQVFDTDEQLCFLPLCHILERLLSVFLPIFAGSKVNFAESTETVFENIQEVSPTVFTAVPRVWEKMYSRTSIMMEDATPFGRWAFRQALKAGHRRLKADQANKPIPLTYRFWDFVLLRNLRRMLGMDKLRRGGTGAAPISPDLLKWFRAIGVPIYEGYGMSETAGVMTINLPEAESLGSVGRVVPGAEVRIGDGGEIQYKGANCFKGYWKSPEKTKDTFTSDGWLRSGDIGRLDNQGYLTITGRMKDIIITQGGKNITPAEIENRLKFSPYISDSVVIGDNRKYLSCLIMIDQENVEKFAQDRRVPFSDFASLCRAKPVIELIESIISEVNKSFARVEQIKSFRLIDTLLTAEDDELTATMKLKRSFVEQKYQTLIDEMYQ